MDSMADSVPTFFNQGDVIEPETAFDFLCLSTVALVALLDRSNLALEKRLFLPIGS